MSSGILTNKTLSLDSLTVKGVPITGGSASLQSGLTSASSLTWIALTGGLYQGVILGVSGVSPTSKITVATQITNTTGLGDTLTAMETAWIVSAFPSNNAGGQIFVYLAGFPNATNNPGAPVDANFGISWCVNSL